MLQSVLFFGVGHPTPWKWPPYSCTDVAYPWCILYNTVFYNSGFIVTLSSVWFNCEFGDMSLKYPVTANTHTHTHTHVGFYGLRGLSIGVMVFILYKLYVLLPYTFLLSPQKTNTMIYKHFKLWGHWKCPHKSPSPCNTYVIPMSLYKFVSS